ncbi:MAG: HAMP domain-containing sensor histidine kinase [Bacteroidota bacterium]
MKIKSQLIIFNLITRLLVILVFWLVLPVLVQKVVYRNINKSLVEKKQKFLEHLDKEEINDFILRNDTTETYASFSTLHSEFLQLSRLPVHFHKDKTVFVDEPRIIEGERDDYRILKYQFLYEKTPYELEIGNNLSEIKELTFIIRIFVFIVLFFASAVVFALDAFFIDYLLKPFYKIIDTKIRHVNEPDLFDHTPINSTSSDFRELDIVLNQMMDRISDLFKKEKQFIANVSHELLTPIALLKNKFENLLQNESLDDNAMDKIVSSLRTLDMLKKIINNLLLISKIDNNQYESNETIDLYQLLFDLIEDLKDRIEEKNIAVKLELQHHFECIGNKTLMHILLYNLIVNAIKYNTSKGSIMVSDGYVDSAYFLSIADTGIGMDESQIGRIFDRFSRINATEEGHGLGLAIVGSVASFHQIKIEVSSKINEGTTFLLHFPNKEKLS